MKKLAVYLMAASLFWLTGCVMISDSKAEKEDKVSSGSVCSIMEESVVSSDETAEEEAEPIEPKALVVIDAGHQRYGNSEQEPVGPGAYETKSKVTGGTSGISSGKPEYELTLEVASLLRDALEEANYKVIMVRDTNDVDISNAERAKVANDAEADVFIRLHANGSENHSVSGAMTICQTTDNPYNAELHDTSYLLSECVLDEFCKATGIEKEYIWETDTMSGINWAAVPCTILEMGYMTNPEEDEKMASKEFQKTMADGIVNGIERYLNERE